MGIHGGPHEMAERNDCVIFWDMAKQKSGLERLWLWNVPWLWYLVGETARIYKNSISEVILIFWHYTGRENVFGIAVIELYCLQRKYRFLGQNCSVTWLGKRDIYMTRMLVSYLREWLALTCHEYQATCKNDYMWLKIIWLHGVLKTKNFNQVLNFSKRVQL